MIVKYLNSWLTWLSLTLRKEKEVLIFKTFSKIGIYSCARYIAKSFDFYSNGSLEKLHYIELVLKNIKDKIHGIVISKYIENIRNYVQRAQLCCYSRLRSHKRTSLKEIFFYIHMYTNNLSYKLMQLWTN